MNKLRNSLHVTFYRNPVGVQVCQSTQNVAIQCNLLVDAVVHSDSFSLSMTSTPIKAVFSDSSDTNTSVAEETDVSMYCPISDTSNL